MSKKLHDLMAFLYSKITHKADLSKARFTKLVYLADWKMSQKHGRTISNIEWLFNHYGPYVDDVVNLARDSSDFNVVVTRNPYGSLKEQIEFVGDIKNYNSIDSDEVQVIEEIVRETDSLYFNDFIDHVYSTFPVKESNRYAVLDLPKMAQKEVLANKALHRTSR
ncbi:Panacea domain-containing protein [Pseudoalteromonas sp. SCQQ13]|uniref:Panacea domain-containing protein n=1 Tax=Pseudoalteromonas sp. SCQQ13 TaxID=2792066 RepID=UPI0018CEAB48|nr:Panacea domain-containing protein [Pseudoalteromonas sp. SCQQ13]MBH0092288.1 SocA family protein [Pseudoalteromonas sp. SCQQ13]